ncbi:hypothetical protein EJB05_37981, partial [Eragrostis curvula]
VFSDGFLWVRRYRNLVAVATGYFCYSVPYYAPDQWPYQLESSMDPPEHPQSEQVNYVIGAQIYREDVDVVASPTTRKSRGGSVSRRGGGGGWFHKRRRWSHLFCLPQRKQRSNNRCQSEARRLLQTVA